MYTNQIPRKIPDQNCLANYPILCSFMCGVFPFYCICAQLFYIFNILWLKLLVVHKNHYLHLLSFHRTGQMFYMFGFVFLTFIILTVVCAETSIVACYFWLCREDYRWWWRSFFATGTTGFYLLCYSVYYLLFKSNISGLLSYFLFFGHTFIMALIFSIITGKQPLYNTISHMLSRNMFLLFVCRNYRLRG